MDNLKKITAANIIKLRTSAKMTQFELGEQIHYSDKAISKWERGESIPDAYVLKKLSGIFGVSVDYLLSEHSDDEDSAKAAPKRRTVNRGVITVITLIGVWTVALLIFTVMWTMKNPRPMLFAYTVPVSLTVWLILNSIWGSMKNNMYIISAMMWSILACIYLAFLTNCAENLWMIFILGIPAQIIIYLCFKIRNKA